MREWRSQSHVRWYCRYHVVIVPKYRRKTIYPMLRKEIGNILKELCSHCEVELIEGHALSDHVHMCLAIPPKHSVANIVGKLKGKSTMIIHQRYGRQRNFVGVHFWSRGYCLHFPRKPIGEQAPADEISPPHLRGRELPQPGSVR